MYFRETPRFKMSSFLFFFFGCAARLAGSYQGLNLGPDSESTESQPLDGQATPYNVFILISHFIDSLGTKHEVRNDFLPEF